jgi:hypothetical protein
VRVAVTEPGLQPRRDRRTRRGFLGLAALATVGGSALPLAACDGDDDEGGARIGGERAERDIGILNSALELEHRAIAAYGAGARLLEGELLELGRTFLEQEREHARALEQAIGDLGGTALRPKPRDEYARALGLSKLRSQRQVLELALDLERRVVAAYFEAIPKLSEPRLRQAAGAINTNEAEHISVLLRALGKPPLPDALVGGADRP